MDQLREKAMKRALVALVGVYLLAKLVEDSEKLRKLLEHIPNDDMWHEVHAVISNEVQRREERMYKQAPDSGTPRSMSGAVDENSSTAQQNHSPAPIDHPTSFATDALSFLGWEWMD